MRRRTKIVLAITLMVAALVTSLSYVYVAELLRQRVITTHETAALLAAQLAYLANNAVPDLGSTPVDTTNPEAVRRATAYYLGTDRDLNSMLESVVGSWPMIYDAAITDADGKAILHTNPELLNKPLTARPDFQIVQDARPREKLRLIYKGQPLYDVRIPLQLNGAPFGSVRVGVSTVFLRNELTPRLQQAAIFSAAAILLSLVIAAVLSHIALGPLEHISRSLDSVSTGDEHVLESPEAARDEYGLVTLKIAHLGRQMRDTKEIFSALKDNVDQIMANLQDGLMLFTRDSRVVLVSASVERFLGRPRRELLGRTAKEIFTYDSPLGALTLQAFEMHKTIPQREIEAGNGKRVQVALDFIQERGTQIGALLTIRDTESVRRIEDEIETSRRLSASGRLTRGVAHEVKNPINAIVLHLQLLQNKLQQVDPDTRRHMDIIDSEIHRLDRVVQILVDFTRPRDLHLEETDLRRIVEDVALLAAPDAEQHGVAITREIPAEPLLVRADTDFMKQAILNVVLNGVQAMPQGGHLTISTRREEDMVVTEIRDEGSGIPADVQEKIFELYFTTKKEKGGSGIGLAQTYQILQWHYGSVDFESVDGQGTTFRLRLPLLENRVESLQEAAPAQASETGKGNP
ncbi:MAG: PAS domain-containing protein [Acidobacteria bacterium]|jgi:PAS domain S-box-containing protein|nr:PAS domain-containing protein [Acidobacteriota bacterium]